MRTLIATLIVEIIVAILTLILFFYNFNIVLLLIFAIEIVSAVFTYSAYRKEKEKNTPDK